MRAIVFIIFVLQPLAVAITAVHAASPFTNDRLIDGFNKTVFGSEYAGLLSRSYVRKFAKPVRFYIHSHVHTKAVSNSKGEVEAFIRSLPKLIHGLQIKIVTDQRQANFVVHIVNRADYRSTVRTEVFKQQNASVHGRCMVRSMFTRSGISRSDAVIVADEGKSLFHRCMTEEILQGLGPLNDNRSLSQSMFNDTSLFTSFRRFDRFILNMLYDSKIKNGATRRDVKVILPSVLRRVRGRIEGTN